MSKDGLMTDDDERRKVWWSEDGSVCLLCGNTDTANVFIDGEPTAMEGPCPNCENERLRAKLKGHPHLFMKGLFADQGWLHHSWCWCRTPSAPGFSPSGLSWQLGTENIPTDEKCALCNGPILPGTLAGFRVGDGRRTHCKCPSDADGVHCAGNAVTGERDARPAVGSADRTLTGEGDHNGVPDSTRAANHGGPNSDGGGV